MRKNIRNKLITSVFEGITAEDFSFDEEGRSEFEVKHENKVYKIILKLFSMNEENVESALVPLIGGGGALISMYMFDETLIHQLAKENKEEKLVTGHIYIDNYDEVLNSIDQQEEHCL